MPARVLASVVGLCALASSLVWSTAQARTHAHSLVIPERDNGPRRNITTDDLARLRDIDSLSVSPDGRRFAILVRQALPEANIYRTAWFIGSSDGGRLVYAGDGGEARLLTRPNGRQTGDFAGSVSRWSPDGRFIAYTVLREGQVQVWRSRSDGRGQRQITHNAGDVRDFAWSHDDRNLYFTVGSSRADLAARAEQRARSGYRLQEFDTLFRALQSRPPSVPLETDLTVWRVSADGRGERFATTAERAAFEAASARESTLHRAGVESDGFRISAALRPPVVRKDGALAWLERLDPSQDGPAPLARLVARWREGEDLIVCTHSICEGQVFRKIWWREGHDEILFWRIGGPTAGSQSLHAWSPATGVVRTLTNSVDQFLQECELAGPVILCMRETQLEPRHVVSFDIETGAAKTVANVNPEMAGFRLGRVEPIEWDSDPRAEEFGYAPKAHGVILYPPDCDPGRSYPLFIAPYSAGRFLRGDVGDEHPLLVYAANGFIVLNMQFPGFTGLMAHNNQVATMNRLYDPDLGYPHLSIFSGSTFRGLDLAMTHASIDPARISIGGVSHGAFVPLLMLQHADRFAALSAASGSWSQLEYYFRRLPDPYGEHPATSFPEDADFWAPLDLAQHLETIEAPILFHLADSEVISTGVLIRRMTDARLAVEAFSFPNELHLKWQPAHRLAIYNRNLDWFRFWLQDIEDSDPAKAGQYVRWRKLRELHCKNTRAVRNLCAVTSAVQPPAH
jgi:dipeptidyl aminopeptidase/acylaminoacyl peptidase